MKPWRTFGYSLLELILVLSIAGIIIAVSLRFFNTASNNAKVSAAIHQIKTLTQASYNWLNLQSQKDFSNSEPAGGGTRGDAITIDQLISTNLLNTQDKKNPWGGAVTLAPGSDTNHVRITLNDLNKRACQQLIAAMNNKAFSESSQESCIKQHIYFGDF
jgi:type II secretory pathway pseudopilin PulG